MQKIRVLIVDDAVVIRKLLTNILSSDSEIEVVATAANGLIALAKIPQVKPDLIILDIEMPEMNGIETLLAIKKTYMHLPVIIFSTVTKRGAAKTLEALSYGANDYVTKPATACSPEAAMQQVKEELIPKVKALCKFISNNQKALTSIPARTVSKNNNLTSNKPLSILAIGVSTGGPNALIELFSLLPKDIPVPIVIVQHMPPIFTKYLAESLSCKSKVQVNEGVAGEIIKPGQCWIAPGGYHMTLERNGSQVYIKTNQNPPENSCRPAVDVLFRSVAHIYREQTLALVMTGMGQDGLNGCMCIHEVGGQILVQDEASSTVWGMPGSVVKAGLADKILPLSHLASEIMSRLNENRYAYK